MNERLADNVAVGATAVQSSTGIGGPGLAVDGDVNTTSCTEDDVGQPWWAVDLGQVYDVGGVTITFPNNVNRRNYRRFCSFVNSIIN